MPAGTEGVEGSAPNADEVTVMLSDIVPVIGVSIYVKIHAAFTAKYICPARFHPDGARGAYAPTVTVTLIDFVGPQVTVTTVVPAATAVRPSIPSTTEATVAFAAVAELAVNLGTPR